MYRPQEGDGIWLDFVNREDMERELRAGRKREGIPILVRYRTRRVWSGLEVVGSAVASERHVVGV